jgi:deoxyribodipyrimidine photolyase-related protein
MAKPDAAFGNYINNMSDYCSSCVYHHKECTGDSASPFNFFYWDFLARHRDQLQSQGRMSMILAHLDRMSVAELQNIRSFAQQWHLKNLKVS